MERELILTRLLGKYQKSTHLSNPNASPRRVMLQIHRKDLPEYEFEAADIRDRFNNAARKLEDEGLVKLEWLRDRPIITVISLNLDLEQINKAYLAVGRTHPIQAAQNACSMIEDALSTIRTPWIITWRDCICREIRGTLRLPPIFKQSQAFVSDFIRMLSVYDSLDGATKATRAFSTTCFQNSKRFEQKFQGEFLRVAERFNPEVVEISGQEEFGDREKLALLGLFRQPELYQLSGQCTLNLVSGAADISPLFPYGIAISSLVVDDIVSFGLQKISKVIFIENLTNYNEYLRTEINQEELVVYHAGYLSPKRMQLMNKLSKSLSRDIEVSFWADIDFGGFQMFKRLSGVFPSLKPMRMSAEDVTMHAPLGLTREPAYLRRLESALEKNEFPLFEESIKMILQYGVTIEQEVFLRY